MLNEEPPPVPIRRIGRRRDIRQVVIPGAGRSYTLRESGYVKPVYQVCNKFTFRGFGMLQPLRSVR
jgi:hypothetical protein